MDSARATAINRATVTRLQWNVQRQRDGNGRPVIVADIKIVDEEIVHKYAEGALLLIVMPLLMHAHLLVQGQGCQRRQFQQEVEIIFVAGVQAEPEGR